MEDSSNISTEEDLYKEEWPVADKGWVGVQEKTFTNWANDKLKESDCHVKDIKKDLADGVALIQLLEVLSQGKYVGRYKKKPRMKIHKRENLEIAFRFMTEVEKIPLVNIGAEDIHEGNLKLILGVIWALILHYQIAEGEPQKKQNNAKRRLLQWVNACLPQSNIKNFTTDWNDGRNLAALVDYCKPGLIPDHISLDPSNRLENVTKAMDIAEKELGVPQVLHPEDLADTHPDEMSVMTYISGFCRQNSPGQKSLLEWINQQIPNCPATNFTTDWSDGTRLGALTNSVSGGEFPEGDQMKVENGFKNCKESMEAANNLLGIQETVPPEDFAEDNLDQLTRMTYLTQFRHAFIKLLSETKVVGPGITGDTAKKPTTFCLRAPKMPPASDVNVTIVDPDGDNVPVERNVTNPQEITFFYTPQKAGVYHVGINLNKTSIAGSPYRVSHSPPPTPQKQIGESLSKETSLPSDIKVIGPGITGNTVQKPATILLTAPKMPPAADFNITIVDPDGDHVPVEKKSTNSQGVAFFYTPQKVGVYHVDINLNKTPVANSPYHVSHSLPTSQHEIGFSNATNLEPDHNIKVTGPGIIGDRVNKPTNFSLSASKPLSLAGVDVKIVDPDGSDVTVVKKVTNAQEISFFYTPKKVGVYHVDINLNKTPIADSPYRVSHSLPSTQQLVRTNTGLAKAADILSDIKVSGPGIIGDTVKKPTSFLVSSSGTLVWADLSATVMDPDGDDVPLVKKVTNSQEIAFFYTPKKPGVYHVDINLNKMPIAYHVSHSLPAIPEIEAIGPGITGDTVKKMTTILLTAPKMPPAADFNVTIVDPDGDDVDVKKKITRSQEIAYFYTPEKPGVYHVDINLNDMPVANSPHHVSHSLPPTPQKHIKGVSKATNLVPEIKVFGPGIAGDKINNSTSFILSASKMPPAADLDVKIVDPDGDDVPVEKKITSSQEIAFFYTPQKAGVYHVDINLNKTHVANSPYHVSHSFPSVPQNCFATGTGLSKAHVSERFRFNVNCEQGGDGKLTVDIKGPNSNADTDVIEPKQHNYSVSFIPQEPGKHNITILWDGKHITNSPFMCIVTDPTKCSASGPGLSNARVGSPQKFKVEAEKAGPGKLSVKMKGPSGDVPVEIKNKGNGNFECSYIPMHEGIHTINIRWSDIPITWTPYKVNVIAAGNASKCTITEIPEGRLRPSKIYSFKVDASKAGSGELTASAHGPSVPESCVVKEVTKDVYTVDFTPAEVGTLKVEALYDKSVIPGSPFQFKVNDPRKVEVNRAAIENGSYQVKQPINFHLSAKYAGEGELFASVHSPEDVQRAKVKNQSNRTYLFHFIPTVSGLHSINIKFDGEEIPNMPLKVFVELGSMPENVVVAEPTPSKTGVYVTEHAYTYKVNTVEAGKGALTATSYGAHTGKKPKVNVAENGNGQYNVTVEAEEPDVYVVNIKWDEKDVPGSPFTLLVKPKSKPENVQVSSATPSKIGAYIIKHSYTYKVNTVGAGEGTLTATSHGIHTGQKLKINAADGGNGYRIVTLEAETPDTYVVNILWDGKDVPGSPFTLSIEDKPRPEKVVCIGPYFEMGSLTPITTYVNTTNAGAGKLNATCLGKEVGAVKPEITEHEPKKYVVSFSPPKFDIFSIRFFWSSENVKNSPFTVNIIPPDASKCVITGPELPENADEPVILHVDASNAGNGKLAASAVRDVSSEVGIVTIKEAEPNKFDVSFIPDQNKNYDLSVLWSDKAVPGSPFKIKSSTPYVEKVVCESLPNNPEVGKPICIRFDTSQAGRGDLKASCKGSRVGKIPVSVLQKSDLKDKFDVCFTPPEQDIFILNATWAGKPISSYTFDLLPVDAQKVRVIGPTLPQGIDGPIELMLQTSGAGKAKMSATCVGQKSSIVNVNLKETSADIYQLRIDQPRPDTYTLTVQYGSENIIGSPFVICTDPPNAAKIRVTEPDSINTSEPLHFKVDAIDAGNGSLEAACCGEKYGPVNLSTRKDSSTVYDVSFTPHHADCYSVAMEWEGEEVPGSPFSVDLRPPMADKVRVGELHVPNKAGTGDNIWIDIDCSEAGHGPLMSEARGELSGTITVDVQRRGRGKYRLSFLPKQADVYHFVIFYGGQSVLEKPFMIHLNKTQTESVQLIHTQIPEKEGEMVSLFFNTKEDKDGELTADIAGETCGAVPTIVKQVSSSQYQVTFIPDKPEVYNAVILWSGKPIKGSPFRVDTRPQIHPELVKVSQPTYTDVNEPVELSVDIHKAGPGMLTAKCIDDSGSTLPTEIKRTSSPDLYSVSFMPQSPGKHNLSVYFEGAELESSPIPIDIKPASKIPQPYESPVSLRSAVVSNDENDIDEPVPYSRDLSHISYHSSERSLDVISEESTDVDFTKHYSHLTAHAHQSQQSTKVHNQMRGNSDFTVTKGSSDNSLCMMFNLTFNLKREEQLPPPPTYIDPIIIGLDELPLLKYVGKYIFFKVDATKSGDGSLTVTSDGPSIEDKPTSLDVKEDANEPGIYHISYLPTALGEHTIHIMWRGRKIPGSPIKFEVTCLKFPFGETVSMDIDSDCKEGRMKSIAIHQVKKTRYKVKIAKLFKGRYKLTFHPKEQGFFDVHIWVNNKEITERPYQIHVAKQSETPPVRVGKLSIHDPDVGPKIIDDDLYLFEEDLPFGQPVKFGITARDEGTGNLNVTSTGPGNAEVKVIDNDNGTYICEISPSLPGKYDTYILWNDEPIRGCPYVLSFKSHSVTRKSMESLDRISASGLNLEYENFRIGVPHRFKLHCDEIGDGMLEIICNPRSGAQVSLNQIEDTDLYRCEIIPLEVGSHQLIIQFNEKHILGSPFDVYFEHRGDASKCRMVESMSENQQDTVCFCVSTSGAGKGKLTASVENINTLELVPSFVTKKSEDMYNVEFKPNEGVEYLLSVKYDDQHIYGSPFKLVSPETPGMHTSIDAASSHSSLDYPYEMRAVIPCKPESIRAYGPGLRDGFVGQKGSFAVETAEGGSGTLLVNVFGPKGAFLVNTDRHPDNERTILVHYDPIHVGKYKIDITWSDSHIPGSPFEVNISERQPVTAV